MKRSTGILLCLTALCWSSVSRASGPEAVWSSAQGFGGLIRECRVGLPEAPQAVAGKILAADDFVSIQALSQLPPPDPKTVAWLASRIPGLNTAALRAVPLDPVDAILSRAAAAQASYLDIFTDAGLGRGKPALYYLSQDVLASLEKKWVSGSMPATGTAKDGRPFHMQALVAGNGAVYILYDLDQFSFKDGKIEFKITDSGRVAVTVLGAGDVGMKGVSACGCKGPFCGCAELQRMTKIAPDKVKVKTSRGDQTADLKAVRRRTALRK